MNMETICNYTLVFLFAIMLSGSLYSITFGMIRVITYHQMCKKADKMDTTVIVLSIALSILSLTGIAYLT